MADGRIEWETVQGLLSTMSKLWNGLLSKCYTSHVALARNELVNGFLKTPFEWLVMIDSDIVFTYQDMEWLLSGDDYAVNGVYAQKDDKKQPVTRGLGFTRVHRNVLELLRDHIAIPYEYKGHTCHDFFLSGASGSGGYLGEDSGFWWLLSQIGVFPRIETRVRLQHIGKYRYACDFETLQTLNATIERATQLRKDVNDAAP